LFALTMAGTAALSDDASAFGKRRHRESPCSYPTTGCCGATGVASGAYNPGYAGTACCGQTGMAYSSGYYYGPNGMVNSSPYGFNGNRYGSYYPNAMNPNGMYQNGVYQSGYYTPGTTGNGLIPAGGTIDPRTGLPIAPRTVPNPMPDRDRTPDRDNKVPDKDK
jgi:hypothetical protein